MIAAITWGIVMTARVTLSYFAVYMGMTAGQLGWQNCAMSVAAFFSALIVGNHVSYKNMKKILMISLLGVCGCIVATSFAGNLFLLLFVRVLMGIFAGPLYTLLTYAVRHCSSRQRYTANIGLITLGEAAVSGILWPVLAVNLAEVLGWQNANMVIALPVLLIFVLWSRVYLKQEHSMEEVQERVSVPIKELLKNRNIFLCCIYGTFCMLTALAIYSYAPMYWVYAGKLAEGTMGVRMTGMGIFMALFSLILPYISGKKGRKIVLIPASIIACMTLFILYFAPESQTAAGMFTLFGGFPSILPLFAMAVISVESVPEELCAPAVALVNGTCELLGSALGPMLGGMVADAWGAASVMLLGAVCMSICILAACVMRETGVVKKKK